MSYPLNKTIQPYMRSPSTGIMDYWYGIVHDATWDDLTDQTGKWLIFLPINRLDGILVHVMNDVVRGRLGPMAKTRTRMGKIIGEKDDSKKLFVSIPMITGVLRCYESTPAIARTRRDLANSL